MSAFWKLNLPDYPLKTRFSDGMYQVFDPIRRRYVVLTPEEWVRQNMVAHLVALGYPQLRMANEKMIRYNGLIKRCDTLVYDASFTPLMIAEYKAPTVRLSQAVFDQIAIYNLKLKVPYLLVSNGLEHLFCQVDLIQKRYIFAQNIPAYTELFDGGKG